MALSCYWPTGRLAYSEHRVRCWIEMASPSYHHRWWCSIINRWLMDGAAISDGAIIFLSSSLAGLRPDDDKKMMKGMAIGWLRHPIIIFHHHYYQPSHRHIISFHDAIIMSPSFLHVSLSSQHPSSFAPFSSIIYDCFAISDEGWNGAHSSSHPLFTIIFVQIPINPHHFSKILFWMGLRPIIF